MDKQVFSAKVPAEKITADDIRAEMVRFEKLIDSAFKRLNRQVEILEAIEASVELKIANLERLMQMNDCISSQSNDGNRRYEVIALARRGLKIDEIADILGITKGEVDLILNLEF
ncbi:MAG: helix-turn-helix domain-containing protein [Nitrospirae bacterium YQR-1]